MKLNYCQEVPISVTNILIFKMTKSKGKAKVKSGEIKAKTAAQYIKQHPGYSSFDIGEYLKLLNCDDRSTARSETQTLFSNLLHVRSLKQNLRDFIINVISNEFDFLNNDAANSYWSRKKNAADFLSNAHKQINLYNTASSSVIGTATESIEFSPVLPTSPEAARLKILKKRKLVVLDNEEDTKYIIEENKEDSGEDNKEDDEEDDEEDNEEDNEDSIEENSMESSSVELEEENYDSDLQDIDRENTILYMVANEGSSYGSNDAHPARQYDVDYLDGGKIEWSVDENDQIAQGLKKYRAISVKGARKQRFMSDTRVLSINNIFPHGHLEKYVSICEVIDVIDCTAACRITGSLQIIPGLYQELLKLEDNVVNATRFTVDDSIDNILVVDILLNWYDALKAWNYSKSVTENQYTFQQVLPFISPIFKEQVFEVALFDKQQKDLNVKPDYYVVYKPDRFRSVDLFVLEVKKPGANLSQQIDSDYVKLLREMQMILNKLIENNVVDPVCYGILVDGYDCILYEMRLETDGQYNTYVCAIFRTLRDYLDIALLDNLCKVMVLLKEKINDLCLRIKEAPKEKQKESNWTRRSFGKSKKIKTK